MGFLNVLEKEGVPHLSNTNMVNNNPFQKEELCQLINRCDNIANMFANSAALRATGNGWSEKMRQIMLSYKSIFVYFYDEICGYGEADAFLSNEETGHYVLSQTLVFNNPSSFKQCLRKLSAHWNDVLTVFKALYFSGESNIVVQYESAIYQLTVAFRKLGNYSQSWGK